MARRRRSSGGTPQEKAGLYIRVSLDRAAKKMQDEIISPETQADRARAYCTAQGWEVVAEERDIDESGYRQHYSRRHGLMRLLEMVESGRITKIVVWKFSRLSRRLQEFGEICDRVEDVGGGVVSVTEQVDTSTPAGRLIRNILASFAQFQSEELSEQIFETWLTKARRGERPPGFSPFGTRNSRGILEPDPANYDTLLYIFRQFVATGSVRAVLDGLLERRLSPPRGEEWHVATIRRILTNPAYIGELHWAGDQYEGKWDPVIPLDLWQQAQAILNGRKPHSPTRRDTWMLTGLVVCEQCAQTMWVRYGLRSGNGTQSAGPSRLYACVSHANGRRTCETPYVHAEELEEAVWSVILHLARQTGWEREFQAWMDEQTPPEPNLRQQQLEREREKIKRAVNNLFDLEAEGAITRAQFREQNDRYLALLADIETELRAVSPESSPPAIDLWAAQSLFRSAPEETTAEGRRRILSDLGAKVLVSTNRAILELPWLRVNLHGRLFGNTLRFGPQYQRLNYRGRVLSDKQLRFLIRTYHWADKAKIAARLGRPYKALIKVAMRLKREGLL